MPWAARARLWSCPRFIAQAAILIRPAWRPSAVPQGDKPGQPSDAKGDYASMPSSHAANWFAATMILFVYYRRSLWFMLPGAMLVSFSRIYNGVHYPSDVLAGAILGAGYAAASVWTLARSGNGPGENGFRSGGRNSRPCSTRP